MIAVIDGVRTPFCKAGGSLRARHADDLGAVVTREIIARTGINPNLIDEVIFGNVAQPMHAANIARVIALKAGLDESVIAQTVHRNCASGMQSLSTAALQIEAGVSSLVIAGGTESMSDIPLVYGPEMTELFAALFKARTLGQRLAALKRFRPRHLKPVVALLQGLTDPVCGLNMGQTAEILAREFGVTRDEQDAFALRSHENAVAARDRLADEIVPTFTDERFGRTQQIDDGPREGQTLEALAKLRPYFDRHAGTVTVGNACPVTDGAVAMLLATPKRAKELKLEPLGFIRGVEYAALDGRRMGLGPVYATAKLLDRLGATMDRFTLVEINEAFAAQVIANERAFASRGFARDKLGHDRAVGAIDPEKINVNGGAIALGHPVGASGSRIVLTALKELKRRGGGHALATLCVGGGQGAAVALEAA